MMNSGDENEKNEETALLIKTNQYTQGYGTAAH
jgi:hypothetical protein